MKRELRVGQHVITADDQTEVIIESLPFNAFCVRYDTDDIEEATQIAHVKKGDDIVIEIIDDLYTIQERLTEQYGYTICDEHHIELADYPYYIPHRDENAFGIELEAMKP